MNYIKPPDEVSYEQVMECDYVLAPSSLGYVPIKNKNVKPLKSLISSKDKGMEIGSFAYISNSNKFFIRTKALNQKSWIIYSKGKQGIIPINPLYFKKYSLEKGDIIICKDSNIGECVFISDDKYKENYMISGGMIRLKINQDKYYVFSVMKSDFFKEQLISLVARGSTIKHAKDLYLDCLIPFPNGKNSKIIKDKIEAYAKEIILIENQIIIKNDLIMSIIDKELENNQKKSMFNYDYPDLGEVKKSYRLDASIYAEDYLKRSFAVKNYFNGFSNLKSLGFKVKRGSSLEIKGLGIRLDSKIPKSGFYTLIIPRNISEYGTIEKFLYIGSHKKLNTIEKGDILFGGEGFGKGRTFVVCEDMDNVALNYHAIRIFKDQIDLVESIFVKCFISYWRSMGMIDYIGVGGSGGHLAPEYFHYLLIPNFPKNKKQQIAKLYYDTEGKELGIFQLDKRNKGLKKEIKFLIDLIINDNKNVLNLKNN